jgi:hypothetical protein
MDMSKMFGLVGMSAVCGYMLYVLYRAGINRGLILVSAILMALVLAAGAYLSQTSVLGFLGAFVGWAIAAKTEQRLQVKLVAQVTKERTARFKDIA